MVFRKKNNFTLLEMIVSMFLISIIITCLFNFFSKMTKLEKTIEDKKTKIHEIHHAQIRLNQVFSNIYQGDFINGSSFYTKNKKDFKHLVLYISYDNKTDSDPNFSSTVKGSIYINENKELCLETLSRDEHQESRVEILLKNVKGIEYQFLANSNSNLKKYKLKDISKNISWYKIWPQKANILPSSIKIKIIKNDNSLDFAFFLPAQHVNM